MIRSRVPWDEYQALPGVSVSRLKELRRSPLHYAYRLEHQRDTPALALGTAAHCAVLEPERFEAQFAIWNRRSDAGNLCPRRGKYWDEFVAEHAGRAIITEEQAELAGAISDAVRTYPPAWDYLEHGDPEVTMQWIGGRKRVHCKGRLDWLTQGPDGRPTIVGLKTSRDCRHYQFSAQAARLGYHLQWAFYHDGYEAIKGVSPRMVEIVVESEPPHAVAVYSIPEEILAQGRDEYMHLLDELDICEQTGYWPGPQLAEEPLSLPTWAYESQDDLSDIGLEISPCRNNRGAGHYLRRAARLERVAAACEGRLAHA